MGGSMSNTIILMQCDGCYGDFTELDISKSSDGKLELCEACNYANDAMLDAKSGGEDE